ncbi:hypothetical protein niasHT_006192 [Heterodera trifolii]|uniref:Annexin n=1 Tax=Heterodera trifolii TaxID=157864 RepID=A0ABD2M2L6_9BILA
MLSIPQLLIAVVVLVATCTAFHGPTIVEKPGFNAEKEAEKLHQAIMNTKMKEITAIICSISNSQRLRLAVEFKKSYGTDVAHMLSKIDHLFIENYVKLIKYLMKTPAMHDALQMYNALKKKKYGVTIEILATRTNQQIVDLRNVYDSELAIIDPPKHRPLEAYIKEKTSGPFQHLLVSLLNESRDETHASDEEMAKKEAEQFFELRRKGLAAKSPWVSKNAAEFNRVFAKGSFSQLRKFFDYYKQIVVQHQKQKRHYKDEYDKSGAYDIEAAITNEFSGIDKDGYLALIKYVRNGPKYFADLLHEAINGIRKSDTDLIRILISRSEIDLAKIKEVYSKLHKTSLERQIEAKTFSNYRSGLLALLSGNISATNGTANATNPTENATENAKNEGKKQEMLKAAATEVSSVGPIGSPPAAENQVGQQ